ncbi:Beta-lactamase/transpeptidase-like protein [Cordyceps javanica]|uniref:Beta-lactamase/transpeptidase-like protein n=1 Tax=Cordyceps javanica TaxID=43265 RepID=A0A545VSA5_9HYPO|nr:Beta-lactamase/transpeptidase-like protein [Cordyceps javanica]TQW04545.1 Beta-lactamase/transpeptidase-like protein [Cordyceps javanica]
MKQILFVLCLAQKALAAQQFLLGNAFEQPNTLLREPSIQSAVHDITSVLNAVLADSSTQFNQSIGNETAVSVRIVSVHDEKPLLDFHHTPTALNLSAGSVAKIDADSMYRIGSISKLFTVYSLLVNHGSDILDKPVTDFVPELEAAAAAAADDASAVDAVRWREVTVGALASQLAGLARDFSRIEFFEGFLARHPVVLPCTTPVYSNAAFRILAYILESFAKKPFQDVITESVFRPLGLGRSATVRPQKHSVGVIPAGDSGWFRSIGNETATAGFFSSSRDLAEFGRSILAHRQLTAVETRRWMKPSAHTSSLSFSVGAPWEIWRTGSRVTSGYTTDLYTKSGSDGLYNALLVLAPDTGVVISVLAAGTDSSAMLTAGAETAVQGLLPILDDVSRMQACRKYCGTYSNAETNSSLIIAAGGYSNGTEEEDGPGIVVTKWTSRGKDIMATAQAYADSTGSGGITSFKLYPSIAEHEATRTAYRLIFATRAPGYTQGASPPPPRIFDPIAGAWGAVDQLTYGRVAVDEFIFHLDQHGNSAQSVELGALRQTLFRV